MKKLISILLVAMLIIGMFPATALTANAASYEKATSIAVGDTVVLVYVSGSTKKELSSISTTSTKYGIGADFGSAPAGLMPLEVVAGSASGTVAFKTSNGTYLYGTNSNSLNVNATLNTNTSWTVTFDGSGNAVIKNAEETSRTIRWNPSSPRFACYASGQSAVQLYKLATGGCEHANTENRNIVAPDCETVGTHDVYCFDCETYIEEGVETAATGHKYVNGICTNAGCGQEQPAGYTLVTDVSTLKANDKVVITITTKAGKTYAMSNNNGTDKAPAGVVVTVDNGVIAEVADNLVWNISYSNGDLTIYPDGVTNKWLYCTATNNGVRVGDNANKVFTVDATTKYLKHTSTGRYLGVYETTPDWRCYTTHNTTNIANQTLAFYKLGGSSCDHSLTVTIPEVPATCTTAGTYEIQKCACGQTVVGGGEIPALDHSYADDACIRCGIINLNATNKAELMTALPENGDVIIIYHVKEKVLMSAATISTDYGNRMGLAAAEANGTQMPYSASAVSLLTVEIVDNQYRFLSADGKYMTSGATGNSLSFTDDATEYSLWEIEELDEDNKLYIHNANAKYNNTKQTLEVYNNAFYPYSFNSSYSSSYELQLYLVEKGAEPVVEMDGVKYNSFEEAYKYDPDTTIKLLTDLEDITVTGDLYLDLNGFDATNISANAIFAYDGSVDVETADIEDFGVLTTNGDVEVDMDYTVGGKRYIALENNGEYTFHVLQMKMSAVTLRTNAAGIYYKATVICDPILAAAVDTYGVALSTRDLPGDNFAIEQMINNDKNAWTSIKNEGKAALTGKADAEAFTSGSVFNIFKGGEDDADRGKIKIYANAYLDLGNGRIVMASNDNWDAQAGTAWSLKNVIEALNNKTDLTDAQKGLIYNFYDTWKDAMTEWEVSNIADWSAYATPAA